VPPALARTGAGASTILRFVASEKDLFCLIGLHGEVRRAAPIGVDQLHQASVRFSNVGFGRAGAEAENLKGFRFRHRTGVAFAIVKFAIATFRIVAISVAARASV
jgi:hypothetical protein